MTKSLNTMIFSSLSVWLVLAVALLIYLYPLDKSLRRGIDLAGGTYITLSVESDKAVEAQLFDTLDGAITKLKTAGKETPIKQDVENNQVILTFKSLDAAQSAFIDLKGLSGDIVSSENDQVRISFSEQKAKKIKNDALLKNIEVLRTRLDKLGVGEIMIAAKGDHNIVVELPGVSDPQLAKSMIGTAAILEFKLVEKAGPTEDEILFDYDGEIPSGMEIDPGEGYFYLVPRRAAVTGKYLKDASASRDEKSEPVVAFEFSGEGADKFYDLTSKNYGRTLAAILDGKVITAARINSAIRNSGIIQGKFTIQEAQNLALLFKSGSYVAPVKFEEERQVAPTLGAESIRQGLLSCLVGLVLLFIFSLYYYSLSGLFAFITLIYNLILILAALSWLGATLTLPGIGGMVLTLGMAIDASILIYERIKEELAEGLSIKNAVSHGFSDAMRVILDANITTFIVGIVLYKFGTGPIQGFAVTMMLGIISTLITGLFFLRSIFGFYLNNFSVQKLRI